MARLATGATVATALNDVKAVDRRLASTDPQPNRGTDVTLIPLRDEEVGDVRPTLIVLSLGAGLVLFVVCANISNLVLARVTARDREIADRVALGASSRRVIRQLVTEILILNLCGAAAGLLLAGWAVEAFEAFAPADVLRLGAVTIDPVLIAITLLLPVAATILCAFVPVWRVTGRVPTITMARSTARPETHRARALLLSCQVTLAFVAITAPS